MIARNLKLTARILATAALTIGAVIAEPYQSGEKIKPFTALDQHDKEFTLRPADVKFLLVSHDMETGKKANAKLTARGNAYLGSKSAVFLANIHGMPGIGRMFAMRKMRRYAHRIILGDSPELIAKFPHKDGQVTVLKVKNGTIDAVDYWSPDKQDLDEVLK